MDDLENSGFFEEYKNLTPFWKKRFIHLSLPTKAMFLVGAEAHQFILVEKKVIPMCEIPEKYQLMINTDTALAFRCTSNVEINNQTKLAEFDREKTMSRKKCEYECMECAGCETCGAGIHKYDKSCTECMECRISHAGIDAGLP